MALTGDNSRAQVRRSGLSRLRVAAVALGVVGTLLVGAGLGQFLWPAHMTQQVVVGPASMSASANVTTAQFPDVLGLDVTSARGAIASAGFAGVTINTETRPAAGPESFVVGQDPAPYSQQSVPIDKVTLTLSVPVPMPDLIGKSAEDAKRAVTDLYGVPQLVRVTTADQPAGAVLATEPAAGSAMPVNVTLRVSDGGDSLSLLTLTAVGSSRCDKEKNQAVNGQLQAQAVTCTPGTTERPAFVEYAIGRHATYLDATLGMLDTGPVGTATIRVVGDGKVLATTDVKFGGSAPLHVLVRDVLRLRIEVTGPATAQLPRLVLGGVRLVGNPDDLDQIGA